MSLSLFLRGNGSACSDWSLRFVVCFLTVVDVILCVLRSVLLYLERLNAVFGSEVKGA